MAENKYHRPFQFKQFSISQSNAAMKVGTDGVLLGALADANQPTSILDIGTGTGLIAMMLAQRFPHAQINAIEPDTDACTDAVLNFNQTLFQNRIKLQEVSLQDYHPSQQFDLIVCNPPYYKNALSSGNRQRDAARHNQFLPFEQLFASAFALLSNTGKFYVIVPAESENHLQDLATKNQLYADQFIRISSFSDTSPVRLVAAFKKEKTEVLIQHEFIYSETKQRSEWYSRITGEFYL